MLADGGSKSEVAVGGSKSELAGGSESDLACGDGIVGSGWRVVAGGEWGNNNGHQPQVRPHGIRLYQVEGIFVFLIFSLITVE